MEQLIYRYGLPGLPVSIGIYLVSAFYLDIKNPEITGIPVVIALSLLLGYFFHQTWMIIFEWHNRFRYDSPDRKALVEIKNTIRRSRSKKIRALKKENLYDVWDTFLYSDEIPSELRKKDRGMWNSYHTNIGNAIGLCFGIVLFSIFIFLVSPFNLFVFGSLVVVALLAIFTLCIKAHQTRILADNLEVFWVKRFFNEFAKTLVKGKAIIKK